MDKAKLAADGIKALHKKDEKIDKLMKVIAVYQQKEKRQEEKRQEEKRKIKKEQSRTKVLSEEETREGIASPSVANTASSSMNGQTVLVPVPIALMPQFAHWQQQHMKVFYHFVE